MWKTRHSKKMDLLQKTQENLEATQMNNQMLSTIFKSFMTLLEDEDVKVVKTDEEKLKAAYALNLCMVSISQIIDYNDIYILEQEYDAILNNINLEKMPRLDDTTDALAIAICHTHTSRFNSYVDKAK